MKAPYTREKLIQDLTHLGIEKGDTLFIHSSFGTHSPMFRAYKANAKLLMLGVDYNSSTYIHFVEVVQLEQTPYGRP